MGADAMILVVVVVLIFSFKLALSLSSFTLIKRLFDYSSLSAIRVVSSVYLRLFMFFPPILITACNSPSRTCLMMCSANRFWIKGWQQTALSCSFLNLEQVSYSIQGSNGCFLTCIQVSQETGLVFPSLEDCPVCCDPHSQRLSCSQWSRSRCFSGILLLFLWSRECLQFVLWFFCLSLSLPHRSLLCPPVPASLCRVSTLCLLHALARAGNALTPSWRND